MNPNEIREHFQKSCDLRTQFWSGVGELDSDVFSHLINPAFRGGPRWPSLRQAFATIRRPQSTIIATDGLSDPFDQDDAQSSEPYNGFGLEFYVESPGDVNPIKGSWQFNLVYQMSMNAAHSGDYQPLLRKMKYLSMELYDINLPPEFLGEEDRAGVLLGLQSPSVPSQAKLSLETIDVVNIKLLTQKELQYAIKFGAEGREKLAKLFLAQQNPTYSDLKRKSVV